MEKKGKSVGKVVRQWDKLSFLPFFSCLVTHIHPPPVIIVNSYSGQNNLLSGSNGCSSSPQASAHSFNATTM